MAGKAARPDLPPLPVRGVAGDPFSRSHGRVLRIKLNGTAQEGCVLAFDVENGWLRRMKRDLDGHFEVDWKNGVVREETLRGKIEVEWINDRESAKG